jgi:hypothetical protein
MAYDVEWPFLGDDDECRSAAAIYLYPGWFSECALLDREGWPARRVMKKFGAPRTVVSAHFKAEAAVEPHILRTIGFKVANLCSLVH